MSQDLQDELVLKTQAEIEQSIIDNLAICFGKNEAVDEKTFNEKYDNVSDYAISASSAYFSTETTRYQTMFLTLSLLLLALSLFRLGSVKIFDNMIKVDARVLLAYVALIWGVAAIFLCKAWLDYRRTLFVRRKNLSSVVELSNVLYSGTKVKLIQDCFWSGISERIGQSYDLYLQARVKSQ